MITETSRDPHEVLGVTLEATPEAIRQAYLARVKEYPPERFPAEFERIRDAYTVLKDPDAAIRALIEVDPDQPLSTLFEGRVARRSFVGPGPWLKAIRRSRAGNS